MPTKTTVAEFTAFYNDPEVWANEAWYEDATLSIDGKEVPDETDWSTVPESLGAASTLVINGGVLLRPKKKGSMSNTDAFDFEAVFKRWRKAQTTATVVASVPKEKLDELKAFLKTIGGKVE
jgi:hypothetical protein